MISTINDMQSTVLTSYYTYVVTHMELLSKRYYNNKHNWLANHAIMLVKLSFNVAVWLPLSFA